MNEQHERDRMTNEGGNYDRWNDEHGWFEPMTPEQDIEARDRGDSVDLSADRVQMHTRMSVQSTR